jgi:proline dehydrogenase
VLREAMLALAGSARARRLVETLPVSRAVVRRYVPGTGADDAVAAAARLTGAGLAVTLDHLGEDTTQVHQARAVRDAYVELIRRLDDAGLTAGGRVEVSVKLSAVGRAVGPDGEKLAREHAADICAAATSAGTTITLDMEEHDTTDATLAVLRQLRVDTPSVGAVLQAYLHRTEADCRDLATAGSRVRLCKGAYAEPQSVAFQSGAEVDRSFVRCLRVLMAGQGYPMVATHDPRLIDIAGALAVQHHRRPGSYEYQLLYGVRPDEQRRLAGQGETVRVYVPYGQEWYGYLMRRMAERPANLGLFVRSLASRK